MKEWSNLEEDQAFFSTLETNLLNGGFKVFILADGNNGYTWRFKVYTGAENGRRTNNLAHNVVMELTEGLYDRGHELFFDSYYCSVPIVEYLATRQMGCAGIVQKNRKMLPQMIKHPNDDLQRGESIFQKKRKFDFLHFQRQKGD